MWALFLTTIQAIFSTLVALDLTTVSSMSLMTPNSAPDGIITCPVERTRPPLGEGGRSSSKPTSCQRLGPSTGEPSSNVRSKKPSSSAVACAWTPRNEPRTRAPATSSLANRRAMLRTFSPRVSSRIERVTPCSSRTLPRKKSSRSVPCPL